MKNLSRTICFALGVLALMACTPTPTLTPIPPVAQATATPEMIPSVPPSMPSDTAPAPDPLAATSEPVNQYAPQSGDGNLMRGDLRIDSASVSVKEAQVVLDMDYFQPTPCFHLRLEVAPPDAQNKIAIEAYAVAEKDKACTLMALATPLHASFDLGTFPKGHYQVWLNGSEVGEFDS